MKAKIEFLGLSFDNLTMDDLLFSIDTAVKKKIFCKIFTPNVALLIWSRKDPFLKTVYNSSDILTIDGYAIYYSMKLLGLPIKATLSPSIFYYPLLEQARNNQYKIYLVGAHESIVKNNVDVLINKYKGINIVGCHHGYFDVENLPKTLVDDICGHKPDLVLIGMSSPLKEKLVQSSVFENNAGVCIGVGGMFDIVAGKTKYAPKWMRILALEWLYRFLQEPKRMWKRYLTTNTIFLSLLFAEIIKKIAGLKNNSKSTM